MRKYKYLQSKIDAYFKSRKTPVLAKDGTHLCDAGGRPLYEVTRPMTVTGLARALGFCSREEMMAQTDEKSAEAIASALWPLKNTRRKSSSTRKASRGQNCSYPSIFRVGSRKPHQRPKPFPSRLTPGQNSQASSREICGRNAIAEATIVVRTISGIIYSPL
ncbi:MAG: hypothetical protein J6J21_00575 [Clostridia bacterium]|nr:hypothetical protein [Clostridia bacterium]